MADDNIRQNPETKAIEVRDEGGNWIPVPPSAIARLTRAVNRNEVPAEATSPVYADPAAALRAAGIVGQPVDSPALKQAHAKFVERTGLEPSVWLERLTAGKMDMGMHPLHAANTRFLYESACKLTGKTPDPFDLIG